MAYRRPKTLAEEVTAEVEAAARAKAAEAGFDIEKESNGLFRAMMVFMSDDKAYDDLVRRVRDRRGE